MCCTCGCWRGDFSGEDSFYCEFDACCIDASVVEFVVEGWHLVFDECAVEVDG